MTTSPAHEPTLELGRDALPTGSIFADRYEVMALLGEGGMGAVHRVLDRELGELVALKTLRPEVAEGEGALDRFRREVKLARRVTHPNVARTYDLGCVRGVHFITMELIEGAPLSRRLADGRVDFAEALRIGAEIARGLAAAHAAGVVHRDLKPDNVMLAGSRVAITDFGIARQSGKATENDATMGLVVGTPAYMAPEQVEGRELDGRADIYALGVVLFQMLTGRMPFVGDTPFAIAAARLHEDPPDARAYAANLPEPIAAFVREAMARSRDRRPDAQTTVERLDEMRAGRFAAAEARVEPARPSTRRASRRASFTVGPMQAEGDAQPLATQLGEAIGDALCALPGVQVLAPGTATPSGADWIVGGSVRRSGDRVRVALRLIDAARGAQVWADRVEMTLDPFAVEDRVVGAALDAIRARVDVGDAAGPRDPIAREMYRRGRAEYATFTPSSARDATTILEDAHARFPDDAWITGALAAALVRSWMFENQTDRDKVARAEEMALRALAVDAGRGEALVTLGIIRWQFGELRAAARAFEDAVERTPRLGEAHEYLGQILCEAGHVDEGIDHLELATKLEFSSANAEATLVLVHALRGDYARADDLLRRIRARSRSAYLPNGAIRRYLWQGDSDLFERKVVRELEAANEQDRRYYGPFVEAVHRAMLHQPFEDLFRAAAEAPHASLRRRSFFSQISAEANAVADRREQALQALELGASLLLFDLPWLDRCPLFAGLRDDPRFARVRAVAAERAAQIWR